MAKFKDLTGRRFGRLIAKSASRKRDQSGNVFWNCLCICGVKKLVRGTSLLLGRTRSCGCLLAERSAQRVRKIFYKHGHNMYNSPTYRSWTAMIQRATNPHNPKFKSYGAIGVTVCDRWRNKEHGFENFLADKGIRPAGTSLGRFLDIGPYSAENTSWQTPAQQAAEGKKKRQVVREILNQFAFQTGRKKAA